MGIAHAKRVLLLGGMIPATELQAPGVIQKIVEADAFEEAVATMSKRASENAPITRQVSKTALLRPVHANLPNTDDLTERTYGSADFRHGVWACLAEEKSRTWTDS
jgi:enoyl-CoA hydratase